MNIIFDIGMVLADFRWHAYCEDLGIPESSISLLAERMILTPDWDDFDRGIISAEDFIEKLAVRFPECPEDYRKFWEDVTALVVPFDYSECWLRELKEKGHKVYILSNYSEYLFGIHSKAFTFLNYTEGRVVSYEYKLMKPEPEIYKILIDKFSLDPADSVFIDDRPVNIEGGERCGIRGIVFTDYPSAHAKLEEIINERSRSV